MILNQTCTVFYETINYMQLISKGNIPFSNFKQHIGLKYVLTYPSPCEECQLKGILQDANKFKRLSSFLNSIILLALKL